METIDLNAPEQQIYKEFVQDKSLKHYAVPYGYIIYDEPSENTREVILFFAKSPRDAQDKVKEYLIEKETQSLLETEPMGYEIEEGDIPSIWYKGQQDDEEGYEIGEPVLIQIT